MFKFMKSKKGFSLVELMIVVVIMAILVAVAVPIFNSVTGKAREKTCVDNQRQIVTSIQNLYMAEGISGSNEKGKGQDVKLKFQGNTITLMDGSGSFKDFENASQDSDVKVSLAVIQGSFKTVPVCGDESNYITATIKKNTQGGTATVTTECSGGKHELKTTSA
jgi:prepilin-type N-terminal cleavage/methylation domain-containing protein